MKKQMLLKLALFAAVILAIAIFAGCQKLSNKGTQYTNAAPRIFWADVPIVHQLSRNPVIRYYSTDIDGLVLDYQYCVLLGNAVDSVYGGPAAVAASFPDSAHWTIVHDDSTTVPLYASPDTGIYVDQYVFVRAMDDDSMFSSIIYTNLMRKNHPPTCYLALPAGPQWCLPETTATWKGIRISWIGKDSIDIPGMQPDFQWNARIYGPFADSASGDTLPEHLRIVYQDTNQTTGAITDWIMDKGETVTNLVTGWYIVYAMNRDDAFTTAIPALGYLHIFEPEWVNHAGDTKPILVSWQTRYRESAPGGRSIGELVQGYCDSVNQYYMSLLYNAGYNDTQIDTVRSTDAIYGTQTPIPKALLYNHRLVIVVKVDMASEPNASQDSAFSEYLNVGGMVWIDGRRNYENSNLAGRVEFGSGASLAHAIPFTHFGVSAVFCDSLNARHFGEAQFAGATAYIEGSLPLLNVDTMRVHQTSALSYNFWHALKGVDFIIRTATAEPLYYYNAYNPDSSDFNGLPVAVRYDQGTFRTAYFTFPLYFIQTDQAAMTTQRMLEWFFAPREN